MSSSCFIESSLYSWLCSDSLSKLPVFFVRYLYWYMCSITSIVERNFIYRMKCIMPYLTKVVAFPDQFKDWQTIYSGISCNLGVPCCTAIQIYYFNSLIILCLCLWLINSSSLSSKVGLCMGNIDSKNSDLYFVFIGRPICWFLRRSDVTEVRM